MKIYRRFLLSLAAFLLALRLFPAFAGFALNNLSVPAMMALHHLTAPVPFPVVELLAPALALHLFFVLLRALSRRALRALGAPLSALLVLAAALAVLWVPALAVPTPHVSEQDAVQLAWLCGDLIDRLNASPLAFPDPSESLALAPAAAGLSGCAVKAARYPEWMARAGIWGMFVPLTGEALVDPCEPAPLIPFTAVHELMHLTGIADEGEANVAAWERCMAAGGPFADSARLWALRYAMGQLHTVAPAAWASVQSKMEDALLHVFLNCGAEAESVARFSLGKGDYATLVGYLSNASSLSIDSRLFLGQKGHSPHNSPESYSGEGWRSNAPKINTP